VVGCNYTDAPDARELHPVDCIPRDLAAAYCAKNGGRLPTGAELEYVATSFGRYELYPWGDEEPRCGDAVFGRAYSATTQAFSQLCYPPGGTTPVGTAPRDRLLVSGVDIVDLVGNVSEWASDEYQDAWESCFAPPILLDPRCTTPSAKPRQTARGGNYSHGPLNVKGRFGYDPTSGAAPKESGIRCARADG
jgi:formylglycine-generating enzyme required for sulfatase activity